MTSVPDIKLIRTDTFSFGVENSQHAQPLELERGLLLKYTSVPQRGDALPDITGHFLRIGA